MSRVSRAARAIHKRAMARDAEDKVLLAVFEEAKRKGWSVRFAHATASKDGLKMSYKQVLRRHKLWMEWERLGGGRPQPIGALHCKQGRTALSPAGETALIKWITHADELSIAVSPVWVKAAAMELAEQMDCCAGFKGVPCDSWYQSFKARHHDFLNTVVVERYDSGRLHAEENIETYSKKTLNRIAYLIKEHKLKAKQIFNCDETRVGSDKMKAVLARAAKRGGKHDRAKGELDYCSLLPFICADGRLSEVLTVVTKKPEATQEVISAEMVLETHTAGFKHVEYKVSPSGYFTPEIITGALKRWADEERDGRKAEEWPLLLITDGHDSHTDFAVINFCRKNNIHLVLLPPHSTHLLQPLDLAIFGPTKHNFRAHFNDEAVRLRADVSNALEFRATLEAKIVALMLKSLRTVCVSERVQRAFGDCGLYPPNLAKCHKFVAEKLDLDRLRAQQERLRGFEKEYGPALSSVFDVIEDFQKAKKASGKEGVPGVPVDICCDCGKLHAKTSARRAATVKVAKSGQIATSDACARSSWLNKWRKYIHSGKNGAYMPWLQLARRLVRDRSSRESRRQAIQVLEPKVAAAEDNMRAAEERLEKTKTQATSELITASMKRDAVTLHKASLRSCQTLVNRLSRELDDATSKRDKVEADINKGEAELLLREKALAATPLLGKMREHALMTELRDVEALHEFADDALAFMTSERMKPMADVLRDLPPRPPAHAAGGAGGPNVAHVAVPAAAQAAAPGAAAVAGAGGPAAANGAGAAAGGAAASIANRSRSSASGTAARAQGARQSGASATGGASARGRSAQKRGRRRGAGLSSGVVVAGVRDEELEGEVGKRGRVDLAPSTRGRRRFARTR